jgi:hypothetical protein
VARKKTLAASEGIAPVVTAKNAPRPKPEGYIFGRPTTYSTEIAEEICRRMTTRDQVGKTRSLRSVCSEDDMPIERTVYNWLIAHEDFLQMYARAKDTLADMNAEDILDIADKATDANLARLQIDARKWWASKVAPKKYGDKIMHAGHDGDALPQPVIHVTTYTPGSA